MPRTFPQSLHDALTRLRSALTDPARLKQVLLILAAFSPALVMAWHVSQNAVNTPVWDDWERGPLIEKFREGSLTFRDLYAPHIDHRIFFPRLIILACNELSGGDMRWEIAAAYLMVVAAAWGVWRLARSTVFEGRTLWGVVFVTNLILFSPIPWDNWLWGVQIAFMMPMAFTVWALVVCRQRWRWWVRLLVAAVLAVIGTHSFGHGFAVWPAVFGVALLAREFTATRRQRVLFLVGWALIAGTVIGCYTLLDFHNSSHETHSYEQPPGAPPPSVVNRGQMVTYPMKALTFMAILAGNPFARMHLVDPLDLAPLIGCAVMAAFVFFGVRGLLALRREPERWDRALPWLALGGAALVGMAAVTVGRLNLAGYTRAASIRYVSISQYLSVAVLMLGVLWWQGRRTWSAAWLKPQWGTVLLAVFAGFMLPLWNYGIQMMQLCREARLQGRAALMFINHWDPQVPWRIDAKAEFPRQQANILNRYDLLDPPLVETLELAQFKPIQTPRPVSQALVSSFEKLPGGDFAISGHARIGTRPADLVLFTWEAPGHEPLIFAAAEPTVEMVQQAYPNDLELVGRMRPEKTEFCEWSQTLRLEDLGFATRSDLKEVQVRAWVFDVERRKAYRIDGEWRISRAGKVLPVAGT